MGSPATEGSTKASLLGFAPGGWIGALFVGAVALVMRALNVGDVFTREGIVFGGSADELYHLRRIQYAVERFPESLSFDRYLNYPNGAEAVWPAAFDWSIAAVARGIVGAGDPARVELVAAWAPPVLGALTALFVFALARRLAGPLAGWTAGLILAVLPASVRHGQLGAVDHHVAVALLTTGLLAGAFAFISAASGDRRGWRALALGGGLGAVVAVWPGALLHAALVQLATVVWALLPTSRQEAVSRATSLAFAHALAAAIVLPGSLGHEWTEFGAWSPFVLCNLQPTWFAAGALVLGVLAAGTRTRSELESRRARVGFGLGVGAAVLFTMLLALPELRASVATGAAWFGNQEAFQGHVEELTPLLLGPGGNLRLRPAFTKLSWLLPAFPLAWCFVARRGLRDRSPGILLLALWSAFFFLAALSQTRFVNSFSVAYALVFGLALHEIVAARPRLRIALLALVFSALAVPTFRYSLPILESTLFWWRGQAPAGGEFQGRRAALRRVGEFLRNETPETRGWHDAKEEPEYAVLSAWGSGHGLRYYGQRPMVQDNFGVYGGRENFDRSWRYFESTDETAAVALLEEMGVRYVVADRYGAGASDASRRYDRETLAFRLARAFGSGRRDTAHSLGRHRMVFHTGTGGADSALWIPAPGYGVSVFEIVDGARVEGQAEPGATVAARLELRVGEQSLRYLTQAQADERGWYALVLPYPTEDPASSFVRATGLYDLRSGAQRAELHLSDAQVREGAAVAGPPLQRIFE